MMRLAPRSIDPERPGCGPRPRDPPASCAGVSRRGGPARAARGDPSRR